MRSGRLVHALAQLSGRERVLLTLLGLVAVPLAVVFLAALPLLEAREAARGRAEAARDLLTWVSDQVRALPAADAGAGGTTGTGAEPIGISGIEESLVRAGLRENASQLSNRAEGGVELALDAAPFATLGAWLAEMTPVWGYDIASFRIEAASAGLVNAGFVLERAR